MSGTGALRGLLRRCALVLVMSWAAVALAEEPTNTLVTLWVNDRSLGTGFFISPDGQVLTAYHVIKDAHTIRVLHQGTPSSDVVVEAFSPEHDLALLRVGGLPRPTPYLRVSTELPPGSANEELHIFGHAAGFMDQRLSAHMTTQGPRLTGELRGAGRERIFALDDVRVIPLQTDLYSGISGGPVVSSRGVIGVLSGSLEEGGTIAWAIPGEYARPELMRPVNKRPEELREWPPVALMSHAWKNVRKAVSLDPELTQALDQYFEGVEKLTLLNERIPGLASQALVSVRLLREMLETGTASVEMLEIMWKPTQEQLTAFGEAETARGHQLSIFAVRLQTLADLLDSTVPRTQQNDALLDELNVLVGELNRFHKQLLGAREASFDMEMLSTLPDTESSSKEEIARALVRVLRGIEPLLLQEASPKTLSVFSQQSRLYRRLGREFERVLTSGFQGRDEDWEFSSSRGYRVRFPAGWEWGGESGETGGNEVLKELEQLLRAQGAQLDAAFFHKLPSTPGGEAVLPMAIGISTMIPPAAAGALDEAFDAIRRQVQGEPGYRDAEVRRTVVQGRQALLLWMTEVKTGAHVFMAYVPGPQYTLFVECWARAESKDALLQLCPRVIEGIHFQAGGGQPVEIAP